MQRKPVRRFLRKYQWNILLALGSIGMLLGYIGFHKHSIVQQHSRTYLDNLYLTLQLITLESGSIPGPLPWELEIARYLLPAVTAYTAITAFILVFNEQLQAVRLRGFRNHIVICGLGRKGILLAEQFLEQGERVVVIEQDEGNDWIDYGRSAGAVILDGDSTDIDLLRRARADYAEYLIATMGDDGLNAQVAVQAENLNRSRKTGALKCIIHIFDPNLMTFLKEKELDAALEATFHLELFSVYDRGANLLMQDFPAWYTTQSGHLIPKHILVVGLGKMGERLIVRAAQEWWIKRKSAHQRLRVTIIDKEAAWKTESLIARYAKLENTCQIEPLQINIYSKEFQEGVFLRGGDDKSSVDQVYICLDDESLGLQAGLVINRHLRKRDVPVVVRMVEDVGLASLLNGGSRGNVNFRNLHAFGLLNRTCTVDLLLGGTREILARSLHEEYLNIRQSQGESVDTNPTLVPWDQLPEEMRDANRHQINRVLTNLQVLGYHITHLTDWEAAFVEFSEEEVEEITRMEHASWVAYLMSQGWTYAEGVKDPSKKTNPYLISWEALPEQVKEDNRREVRRLPAFLFRAGFQIESLRRAED